MIRRFLSVPLQRLQGLPQHLVLYYHEHFSNFFLPLCICPFPFREYLHPHATADLVSGYLPQGCQGFIAIIRNWTFTLFYVMSELWGTIIMSVLFWGVANEVTSLGEAKRFYAILGVGANLATVVADRQESSYQVNFSTLPYLLGVIVGDKA